jgi:hypothetical protein
VAKLKVPVPPLHSHLTDSQQQHISEQWSQLVKKIFKKHLEYSDIFHTVHILNRIILMRIRIDYYFNADPARTFHLTFHSNADPDPAAQNIADPDPQPCFKLYPILPNKIVWKNYVKYLLEF